MRSVMQHMFSEVPQVGVPRSSFERSHGYKTTLDCSYLVPVLIDEVLPGDTYQVNMAAFARLATPIFPIMDNMRMESFFFFVPTRLVWDNWQKFCGERTTPNASIDYLVPQYSRTNEPNESLWDYFGLPTNVNAAISVSALPFRCYALIWNEWFRDQNLQTPITVPTGDGPDTAEYLLMRRGKRHDYFTSSLPWLQKGEAIDLPLGTSAEVKRVAGTNATWVAHNAGSGSVESSAGTVNIVNAPNGYVGNQSATATFNFDPKGSLYADLSEATAATVNELRQAFQVQRMLERDARSGTRYTEILQSYYGVTSPDARLQRPEYLGGGSSPVRISPIAQTFSATGTPPTGTLAATGTAAFSNHGFVKSFVEHGYVIGLINVRGDITYQQGIERSWLRQTRYDYYWPTLSHLGEQQIYNKEIYVDAASIGDGSWNGTFGYQERSAEYRYKPSKVTGKMRSNDPQSLDSWHLAQDFTEMPVLSEAFILDDPPVDRVIAVPTEPHFIFDSFIQMRTTRPMPIYSVPGYTDHF